MMPTRLRGAVVSVFLLAAAALPGALGQQTLKLSAVLTIDRNDDKVKTNDQVAGLVKHAKEAGLEQNVLRFLENMQGQLDKVMVAAKVIEQQKATLEVPTEFTPRKYRVKAMPKLQAKKTTAKKIAAKELRKRLKEGKDINFDVPMLVTNATELFEDDTWANVRRQWSASRIMGDEDLEKSLKIEYLSPEKAQARRMGQMEDADYVSFSRYITVCFHGTPAKPKLPGQNTEHCEQTVPATDFAHNASELEDLSVFPELQNMLPLQSAVRERMISAAGPELSAMLGKKARRWTQQLAFPYRHFVFGPSGSGDKLHAENGLPFYDVLIHGSRRWLLLTEEEMNKVAVKAKEALEFDRTSAYMFFEEKLPELREEFGLKKYVELNQNAGDMVIVPSGWFRVSLSLADSISYYQTVMTEKKILKAVVNNNVWKPQFNQFRLAYCYNPEDLTKLPGVSDDAGLHGWLKKAMGSIKAEEKLFGILSVLMNCGSVLALDKAMPKLKVQDLTVCTPAVWKDCRSALARTVQERGLSAKLSWLPEKAPTSADDFAAVPTAQPADAAAAVSGAEGGEL